MGSTIKRVFLIIALIIEVPIVYFILAVTCKVFKCMCYCYKLVISKINCEISNLGALASLGVINFRDLARHVPDRRLQETSKV